jgi:hypothetical protein
MAKGPVATALTPGRGCPTAGGDRNQPCECFMPWEPLASAEVMRFSHGWAQEAGEGQGRAGTSTGKSAALAQPTSAASAARGT